MDLNAGAPTNGVIVYFPPGKELCIRAGQADPLDHAHFTVACSFGGDVGKLEANETLDCYLLNDNTVRITPRSSTTQIGPGALPR